MSSRVQKGGQKFRPVAKARPRAYESTSSSRQLSSIPEARTNSEPQSTSKLAGSGHLQDIPAEAHLPKDAPPDGHRIISQDPLGQLEGFVNIDETSSALARSSVNTHHNAAVIDERRSAAPTVIAVGRTRAVPTISRSQSTTSVAPNSSAQEAALPTLLSVLHEFSQTTDPQTTSFSTSADSLTVGTGQQGVAIPPLATEDALFIDGVQQQDGTSDNHNSGAAAEEGSNGGKRRTRKTHKKAAKGNQGVPAGPEGTESCAKRRRRSKTINNDGDTTAPQPEDGDQNNGTSSRRKSTRKSSKRRRSSSVHSDPREPSENESDTTPRPRKKRTETTGRKKRPRAPSPPAFDVDADPGEDLDPTTITMAAICNDTGQGRVSSKAAMIHQNFSAWKRQSKEKRAQMRVLAEAKKYGRNEDDVGNVTGATTTEHNAEAGPSRIATPAENTSGTLDDDEVVEPDASGSGFDYSQALATSNYNVQIRIGPNGETIIDEESLVVDRGENAEAEAEDYTHIEESDQTKFVNSMSYSKKTRGARWNAEETDLFYDALSQFGENYELISMILPGRDRKACKNKFKAEDKKNPFRITHCLNNRTPVDMETLSRMTGKDFSGPTPEIRAPEILTMEEVEIPEEHPQPHAEKKQSRKRSRTPRAAEDGVEVVGDIDSYVDDD